MYRGTTPTLVFTLDTSLNIADAKSIWVTLESKTAEKTFDKSKLTIDGENNKILLPLTQEDTLEFKGNVSCQVRFLLPNGKAYASNVKVIPLNQILKDGVIT